MLQGCKIYLVGYSSMMRNAAEAKIRGAGGAVAPPVRKVPSMFAAPSASKQAPVGLPLGVTHVLCGSGRDYQHKDPRFILEEMGVPALPPPPEGPKVVVGEWLSQSLAQKKRVEEAPYLIDMTPKPAPPPPAPSPPPALKRAAEEDSAFPTTDSSGRGSPGAKRPRPSSSTEAGGDDATSALPPPPPLLAGRPPQPVPGLSRAVPTNHAWVKYPAPLEVLHLKVNGGHEQGLGRPVRIAAFDLDSTLVKVRSGAFWGHDDATARRACMVMMTIT